ncbi:MAG TPA: DegT/DnrJ/EryC1/StrS aminotransferase family protein [Steroidobacteraceae bacterium]|jgi:perosamine synthetase|nr:DegT/DnrJ/EryC1/StrS aminotransferase family protein [Steroidobacteraceae bacterium]
MIAHNRPHILACDRAAVDAVLGSGWIAQGPAVGRLEQVFVRHLGGGEAVALSSGTAALFVALEALGAGAGATVALPSYSCSALLNAVFMTGATPQIVDVRGDNFCLDAQIIRRQAADAGFIVAVHAFGAHADVEGLIAADQVVIEDCCQSLGGSTGSVTLGSRGAAAVFSFYATKVVTAGQGGLVWSRSAAVADRVRNYRQADGREHYEPRFNLQMTDIQAALAVSQMSRLEAIRERRAAIAGAYLGALPHGLVAQAGIAAPGRMVQRFVVVAPDAARRDALRAHMTAAGVGCIVPVERFELLHRYLELDPGEYPVAERLADTTLSLPMHLGLSDADVATVCAVLQGFRP